MRDIVARTFQESFSFLFVSPLTPFPLLENFHDVPDKAGAKKAGAIKSSSEKAFRKLGKILFTFPPRAKTMTIKKLKVPS